jgi:hypothetical protein
MPLTWFSPAWFLPRHGSCSSGLAFDLLVDTPTGSWQCGNDPADPGRFDEIATRHT